MNSFNYDRNSSMETDQKQEANAIAPDTRLRSMGKAFRTINLCIALFCLLWVIMLRLPFAVRILLGEFLRRLLLLLPLPLSPLMISLIFGFCLATVMVQSYRLSAQNITDDDDSDVGTNFYENMVNNIGGELHSTTEFHRRQQEFEVLPHGEVDHQDDEEVVYEDKEIVMSCDFVQSKKKPFSDSDVGNGLDVVVEDVKDQPVMEEDNGSGGGGVVLLENENSSPKDVLNDADFKKTVDAFIKKQRDFLKLENRCDYYYGEAHVHCY